MVGVQEGLGSYVPGFTFNLGFSGGQFSHGDPLEVEGSKEIVRSFGGLSTYPHVQAPEEPHMGTEEQHHPEYCLCQGEGCGLKWVGLKGVVNAILKLGGNF